VAPARISVGVLSLFRDNFAISRIWLYQTLHALLN
jgi:hypothetical protein